MNPNLLQHDPLELGGHTFHSRLFTGTGKYGSAESLAATLDACGSEMITVAFKRVEREGRQDNILSAIQRDKHIILPNTSGVRTAREAVFVAQMAREALETDWLKLEIHPDPKYLMPDPVETAKAAEELVKLGFKVLPYVHADPVLCKRLEELGCVGVMPLGAPIGSNRGLLTRDFLAMIIDQAKVPVIVDAGIGAPSHAAEAMELGAAAVLINTAIADAAEPARMGRAFALAIAAGREAHLAKIAPKRLFAAATSPLTAFLDEE
jgi:thiazole synthase